MCDFQDSLSEELGGRHGCDSQRQRWLETRQRSIGKQNQIWQSIFDFRAHCSSGQRCQSTHCPYTRQYSPTGRPSILSTILAQSFRNRDGLESITFSVMIWSRVALFRPIERIPALREFSHSFLLVFFLHISDIFFFQVNWNPHITYIAYVGIEESNSPPSRRVLSPPPFRWIQREPVITCWLFDLWFASRRLAAAKDRPRKRQAPSRCCSPTAKCRRSRPISLLGNDSIMLVTSNSFQPFDSSADWFDCYRPRCVVSQWIRGRETRSILWFWLVIWSGSGIIGSIFVVVFLKSWFSVWFRVKGWRCYWLDSLLIDLEPASSELIMNWLGDQRRFCDDVFFFCFFLNWRLLKHLLVFVIESWWRWTRAGREIVFS